MTLPTQEFVKHDSWLLLFFPSPYRVDRSDILSGVSYALRKEVSIHSIVSGSAFSALLRFLQLLENVSPEVLFKLLSTIVNNNILERFSVQPYEW